MISIQKLGHLASCQLNKPQRYVLWQLVAVLIGKAISMSGIFLTDDEDYLNTIMNIKILDGLYSPIIVQLTYLGCNRHNLKSLSSSLKPKNFCRVLFCPCCVKERVEPREYRIESTGRD
uniref:DDE_Tnp_1_7 domain-containing protein n=1 Tax=Caenorhabditis tropicalis TaxID=1561998 RepID=A0A1I7THA5_9PELO